MSVEPNDHAEPMEPAEILARAEAFAPTPNREAIMRLALEMIVAQCGSYEHGFGESIDRIQRTAEQALRECGK